ncbi:Bax protein [Gammaproteobacteria bacterium]
MNRYLEAKPLRAMLVWLPMLPMVLHPLSASASKVSAPALKDSPTAPSNPVIEVPRREVKDVPHALQEEVDGGDKQRVFVDTLLPLVLMENELIEGKRKKMLKHFASLARGEALGAEDREWLRTLAADYRVDRDPLTDSQARRELLGRVDIVPVDLALAQAATETGWGASHSARKDRDLFGMTGMRSHHTIRTASGRVVRAPKFSSLREAVRTYIHNLNSHDAYQSLRAIRTKLRTEQRTLQGGAVADGLVKYSTRGVRYVKQIRTVIHQHNLNRYINARLLPSHDQVVALEGGMAYAN